VLLLASITGSLTDFITTLIGNHGVEAVFGLTALAAILPTGGELVMLYAGALAAGAFSQSVVVFGHHVNTRPAAYLTVVAAGIAGDTLGSLCGWAIGIFGGRPLLERHGRWLHLSHERLERAERWFERFGSIAVPLGRITPFARSLVSVPAGVFRARFGSFAILTTLASIVWCFAFASIGFALGTKWRTVERSFRYVDIAVVVLILAAVALIILRRWRAGKLANRDVQDPTD
jgi:membrane protein DedA with SNARE-associated domain